MNKITKEDLKGLNHKEIVIFALFCAKQVVHLNTSEKANKCIEIVELWLEGKVTANAAGYAANAAAHAAHAGYAGGYAGYAAAHAAGYAGYAAGYAAGGYAGYAGYAAGYAAGAAGAAAGYAAGAAGANKEEILNQQRAYLYELKNIDKILEEELLGVINE